MQDIENAYAWTGWIIKLHATGNTGYRVKSQNMHATWLKIWLNEIEAAYPRILARHPIILLRTIDVEACCLMRHVRCIPQICHASRGANSSPWTMMPFLYLFFPSYCTGMKHGGRMGQSILSKCSGWVNRETRPTILVAIIFYADTFRIWLSLWSPS